MSGVEQFFVDCDDNAAQTDDDSQDADRQDQHQFCGNNQSAFVIVEFLKHVRDLLQLRDLLRLSQTRDILSNRI